METREAFQIITSGKMPWQTHRLRSLASCIPSVAEAARCGLFDITPLRSTIVRLWSEAQQNQDKPGWSELTASVLVAADILGCSLADDAKFRSGGAVAKQLQAIARPAIYVLLRGGAPSRVYFSWAFQSETLTDEINCCANLVARFLREQRHPRWLVEPKDSGNSQMAGLVIRALAERWPGAFVALGPIGVTGQLNEEGLFVPIEGVEDKVTRFFEAFPQGHCFVPRENWPEVHKLYSSGKRRYNREQLARVHPTRSVTELAIRLGITVENSVETRFFAALRSCAATISDWRRRDRSVGDMVPLTIKERGTEAGYYREDQLSEAVKFPEVEPTVIVLGGSPGAGKSVVLRRLHYLLLGGEFHLRGPSIRLEARRLNGIWDPAGVLAEQLGDWNKDEVNRVLQSPSLEGCIWLLFDGLDELTLAQRENLLENLRRWKGPLVITTRQLVDARLPQARQLEIHELSSEQIQALLRLESREDLIEHFSYGSKDLSETRPLRDLCSTPLGVALVCMCAVDKETAKHSLLEKAFYRLLELAAASNRISERAKRYLTRDGLPLFGAAAWRMLQEGRSILTLDDLRWALDTQAPNDCRDEAHQGFESSGILDVAGSEQWEFTHKAIAEFCAAYFLRERWQNEKKSLFESLWQPGVYEVVGYLVLLIKESTELLHCLLKSRDNPLSAAKRVTESLLDLKVAGRTVESSVVVAVACFRLRVLGWLPVHRPDSDREDDPELWRMLKGYATELKTYADSVIEVCHPDARAWLYEKNGKYQDRPCNPSKARNSKSTRAFRRLPGWNSQPENRRYRRHAKFRRPREWDSSLRNKHRAARQELAEQLHSILRFEVPLLNLLRFRHGLDVMAERGQGLWYRDLEPYLNHPKLAQKAKIAWVRAMPSLERLKSLSLLSSQSEPLINEILLAEVLRSGSDLQKKEAMVRVALSSESFVDRSSDREDPTKYNLVGRLEPVSSWYWEDGWSWCWRVGAFANYRLFYSDSSTSIKHLFAELLYDPCDAARRTAIEALRLLAQKRSGGKQTKVKLEASEREALKDLMSDSCQEVRIAAIRLLLEAEEALDPSLLFVSLFTSNDEERWLAVFALLACGVTLGLSEALILLAPIAPAKEGYAPSNDFQYRSVQKIVSALSYQQVVFLIDEVEAEKSSKAEQFLRLADLPASFLLELFQDNKIEYRRWAASRLYSAVARPYRKQDALPIWWEMAKDPDPEIAEIGKRVVAEYEQRETQRFDRKKSIEELHKPEQEPIALTTEAIMGLSYKSTASAEEADDLVVALYARELFEPVWEALKTGAFVWLSAADMDGAANLDVLDSYFGEFAARARAANLERARIVVDHLHYLFIPEKHRSVVLDGLNHPVLWYWSFLLLKKEPISRDLLKIIQHGERAIEQIALLAQGSPLKSAVVDEILSVAAKGLLPFQADSASLFGEKKSWLDSLSRLAGLEGLVRLLGMDLPDEGHELVLQYMDKNLPRLGTGIAESTRRLCAGWARKEADDNPATRAIALRLLAVVGQEQDACEWKRRLKQEALPSEVVVAAVTLIGHQAERAESLPVLREMITSRDVQVSTASLEMLNVIGEENDAEKLCSLLEYFPFPTYEIHRTGISYLDASTWKSLAVECVLRYGNSSHALRLARLCCNKSSYSGSHLIDGGTALRLVESCGRLPEHAILLVVVLQYDPGESVDADGDVYESDVPETTFKALDNFCQRMSKDGVRRALLKCVLWDLETSEPAARLLEHLGGPASRDLDILIDCARSTPANPWVLSSIKALGVGETELGDCWEEVGASWFRRG
jgi:hypothetical protein